MKEIKFRAWDKEHEVMEYVGSSMMPDLTASGCPVMPHSRKNLSMQYELMQYIGLKDKNGKEIYEGDIVELHQFLFDGNEIEESHKGIVGYNQDWAAFTFQRMYGKFYEKHTGFSQGTDLEGCAICNFIGLHEESFHVIGNIYETPKLLQGQIESTEGDNTGMPKV